MKLFALTLCLYLNVLTVLPTARFIKMTYGNHCESACGMNDTGSDIPSGCQKEKCVLNFNFNSITFLVFTTDYQLPKEFISTSVKQNIQYHQNLIPNFSVSIWQPPEFSKNA